MRTSIEWIPAVVVCCWGICACGAAAGNSATAAKHAVGRQRVQAPPVGRASEVVTPLHLRSLSVATYCPGVGIRLARCRRGERPVVERPERLVELSLTARRAAGRNSWYAWNVTAPAGCPLSADGGPTLGAVRAGSRLVFDDLFPAKCDGTIQAMVVYVVQTPGEDAERITVVGRVAMRLP